MSTTAYNLNQGQKQAADAFFLFLHSEDKEFIISGPAGVGKTYLMSYIIDNTMKHYEEACHLVGLEPQYDSVEMTATTNKAAEVLSQSTGRPTSTIHSFLALTVFNDFTTGLSKLKKTSNWRVHERKVIFIDECSMIDSDLYRTIQEGTHGCKIVYVGDHNQLAPVTEKLSPVYKQGSPMFVLTEQMRNSGQPALMNICQQLRDTVETDVFNPIKIVPGVIDFLDDNQMQFYLDQTFKTQTTASRILAYTNKRVTEYNQFIRDMRQLPAAFTKGELLVNNSAIKLKEKTISVEDEIEVLDNTGSGKIQIATNPDGSLVELDVDYLNIMSKLKGSFYNVPYPTDREHYNALIKYYGRVKAWKTMYDLKEKYPDLRPRDAATVHKSQGSTYDTVFIDLETISTCTHRDQAARMLYVAFSRARSRVFLYGPLAQKYGGLIF